MQRTMIDKGGRELLPRPTTAKEQRLSVASTPRCPHDSLLRVQCLIADTIIRVSITLEASPFTFQAKRNTSCQRSSGSQIPLTEGARNLEPGRAAPPNSWSSMKGGRTDPRLGRDTSIFRMHAAIDSARSPGMARPLDEAKSRSAVKPTKEE